MATGTLIYKICKRADWQEAERTGALAGSADDRRDGFIHFSTGEQLRETALRHFAGAGDLMILAADPARFGDALRWERSRGGKLFPHLYGPLAADAIVWAKPLPLGSGDHEFPELD